MNEDLKGLLGTVGKVAGAIAVVLTIVTGVGAIIGWANDHSLGKSLHNVIPVVGWVGFGFAVLGGLSFVIVSFFPEPDPETGVKPRVEPVVLVLGVFFIAVFVGVLVIFGPRTLGWVGFGYLCLGLLGSPFALYHSLQTRSCPSCEKRISVRAHYCSNCGHHLEAPPKAA